MVRFTTNKIRMHTLNTGKAKFWGVLRLKSIWFTFL